MRRCSRPGRTWLGVGAIFTGLTIAGCGLNAAWSHEFHWAPKPSRAAEHAPEAAGPLRWWKGNTHTHSWWSDGAAPPESIAVWYRDQGYNFLVFSDHNRMQTGVAWHPIVTDDDREALKQYIEQFGSDWVETRERDGQTEVKLKALDEFRTLVERQGAFTLIRGLEITDRYYHDPVHVNAVNVDSLILPHGGDTVASVIQRNIDAVASHSRRSGRPAFAHLNHPNFYYAVTAEDLISLEHGAGEGFLEIYNGHPEARNEGDETHPSAERLWDIVLSKRLGELGRSVVYGVASDDAHVYTRWGVGQFNPGRGWIMVRSHRLTPDSIVSAIKQGDFYSSTGVILNDLRVSSRELYVDIAARPGVSYTIEFIGTRRDAALAPGPAPHVPRDVPGRASATYGAGIGRVLGRVDGTRATYVLGPDDIYVRARITSSQLHPNPSHAEDLEMAWTQPAVAERFASRASLQEKPLHEAPSPRAPLSHEVSNVPIRPVAPPQAERRMNIRDAVRILDSVN